MPSQDEIMQQIVALVSKGAGVALTSEEESALHERYYPWITTKKDGVPTSPHQVWDQAAGEKIKKQIEKIGKELAERKKKTPVLGKAAVVAAAVQIESVSDCPHCPDPPPTG
jgi:hypothetical protein